MRRSRILKVTHYLTRPEDIPAYAKARTRFLGASTPASMRVISPLVWPEFRVEVEIIAARAAARK
jgi:enamine deaminase RidA (YjgF/YER057c/UK114 family)